jgi:hypothetical protein
LVIVLDRLAIHILHHEVGPSSFGGAAVGTSRFRNRENSRLSEVFIGLVYTLRFCGLLEESVECQDCKKAGSTSVAHTYFRMGDYFHSLETHPSAGLGYIDSLALGAMGFQEEAAARVQERLSLGAMEPIGQRGVLLRIRWTSEPWINGRLSFRPFSSPANRFLCALDESIALRSQILSGSIPEFAAAHLIPPEARAAALQNSWDRFIEARLEAMASVENTFVNEVGSAALHGNLLKLPIGRETNPLPIRGEERRR